MVQEARCVNCGLIIEKDYILFVNGSEFTFDSFECAVNFVAPRCAYCNSVVMDHGVQNFGEIFCNSLCAQEGKYTPTMP